MVKIYTRKGDEGYTGAYGGQRVRKTEGMIAAVGSIDELNSWIGWWRTKVEGVERVATEAEKMQKLLMAAAAEVSGYEGKTDWQEEVKKLEEDIDRMEAELPGLKNFILPGGGEAGAMAQVVRSVCRRCERQVVGWMDEQGKARGLLAYINRLSDWWFVAARWINRQEGGKETEWKGRE